MKQKTKDKSGASSKATGPGSGSHSSTRVGANTSDADTAKAGARHNQASLPKVQSSSFGVNDIFFLSLPVCPPRYASPSSTRSLSKLPLKRLQPRSRLLQVRHVRQDRKPNRHLIRFNRFLLSPSTPPPFLHPLPPVHRKIHQKRKSVIKKRTNQIRLLYWNCRPLRVIAPPRHQCQSLVRQKPCRGRLPIYQSVGKWTRLDFPPRNLSFGSELHPWRHLKN